MMSTAPGRVQFRLHDESPAQHGRHEQSVDQAGGERQREHEQGHGAGPEALLGQRVLQHDRQQGRVGEDDALGQPGGSAGEDDGDRLVGGAVDLEVVGYAGAFRLDEAEVEHREVVPPGARVLRNGHMRLAGQDHAQPGVVGDLTDLGRLEPGIQRYQDRAGLDDGQCSYRPCQGIGAQQTDPVAGFDAFVGQPPGQPAGPVVHVAEGQLVLGHDEGCFLALGPGPPTQCGSDARCHLAPRSKVEIRFRLSPGTRRLSNSPRGPSGPRSAVRCPHRRPD